MNEGNTSNLIKMPHSVVLEDRRRLTVSGVSDVDSFDEQMIVVFTELGELTVKGADLHISRLSLEMGELAVEGDIASLSYAEQSKESRGSFFSRVFR